MKKDDFQTGLSSLIPKKKPEQIESITEEKKPVKKAKKVQPEKVDKKEPVLKKSVSLWLSDGTLKAFNLLKNINNEDHEGMMQKLLESYYNENPEDELLIKSRKLKK